MELVSLTFQVSKVNKHELTHNILFNTKPRDAHRKKQSIFINMCFQLSRCLATSPELVATCGLAVEEKMTRLGRGRFHVWVVAVFCGALAG